MFRCRFGREGLQVTECYVDVKSYTSVQSSERDGAVGNIRFICCGLMNPVTLWPCLLFGHVFGMNAMEVWMETAPLWSHCMHEEFQMPFLEFSDNIYCTQKEGIIGWSKCVGVNSTAVLCDMPTQWSNWLLVWKLCHLMHIVFTVASAGNRRWAEDCFRGIRGNLISFNTLPINSIMFAPLTEEVDGSFWTSVLPLTDIRVPSRQVSYTPVWNFLFVSSLQLWKCFVDFSWSTKRACVADIFHPLSEPI